MSRRALIPLWVWLTCIALAALKLWLTAGQTIFAIGGSLHDDLHFLIQASHLLHGAWLGPYDEFTLIKGPFLPFWIAFAFLLRVPLLLSVQSLYAASCWVLTIALRPLLKRNIYTPVLYALLLFNPESAGITRVLRELITPSLTVLVAACAAGLLLAQDGNERQGVWWAAGLGASFAALWLTREEGLVVLPFLVFMIVCALFRPWRLPVARNTWHVVRLWLVSLLVWAALAGAVAANNLAHYGVFAKTEFDAHSFNAAYGALSRVKPPIFKPLVPVTNATRRLIYPISPAFKELRPYLEGEIGGMWEYATEYMQDESNRHEILGPWFAWALRDAVSAAGYYEAGRYPEEYYARLAREVNAGCDQDLLDCYAPRATFVPVWHNAYVAPTLVTFGAKLAEVVGFRGVGVDPTPSDGTPQELAFFRAMTGNELTAPASAALPSGAPTFNETRLDALRALLRAYRQLNPAMAVVALVSYAALTVSAIRRRRLSRLWMLLTAFAILFTSRLALISFIDTTSMRIPGVAYLPEAFPIMLAFVGLACLAALDCLIAVSTAKAASGGLPSIDLPA